MNLKNKIPIKYIIVKYHFNKPGRLSSRLSNISGLSKIHIKGEDFLIHNKLLYKTFFKYTGRINKSIFYKFYYAIQGRKYLINNLYGMLSDKYKSSNKFIL